MYPEESATHRVLQQLREHCRIEASSPVWVACSGGADSIALAYLLREVEPACRMSGLVFVDHGTRDVRSERQAVLACAESLNVPFVERKVTLRDSGNLQEAAREARYAVIERAVPREAYIATGHTATDQAETVLQRLTRGSGLRGLQAIQPRRGRWIRPLLGVHREETRSLGYPFEDDPTNDSPTYARNRIRHEVLPLLRRENPSVEIALANVARQARVEMDMVSLFVASLDKKVAMTGLPAEWVHTLARWQFWNQYPHSSPPLTRAMKGLVEHLQLGGTTRHFSLGRGVRATASGGVLTFSAETDPRQTVVLHGPGAYAFRANVIKLREDDYQEEEKGNPNELWFDSSEIIWPLRLRPLRATDDIPSTEVFRLPLTGSREESSMDWPNDSGRKIVLLDGLGRVLWVGGRGGTSIAAPTKNTPRCIVVTSRTAP